MVLVAGVALLVVQGCSPSNQAPVKADVSDDDPAHLASVARRQCADRGFPAGEPVRSFSSDGCTAWPDDVVRACCTEHDMAYWCGGTRKERKRTDARLRECVKEAYGEWPGPLVGWIMQAGVSGGGSPHLPTYWRWGYGHAYGAGYSRSPGSDDEGPSEPEGEALLVAAALDVRIPELMEEAGVHGFTMAVAEQGELVWSVAYGEASTELERQAATDTVFEAASLGKVVLALITLRLADQGVIDLDKHLAADFAYPLLDHDPRYEELTPRLLLQHASGLPNWGGWALDEERDPVQLRAWQERL